MVLPKRDQAFEHIRTAQEVAVVGAGRADHDVIAAAGSGMAAFEQELLGDKTRCRCNWKLKDYY